jgi:hypothetical protein
VNCCVDPAAKVAFGGATAIDCNAFCTVSAAVAVNPLAEAVIVAVPGATAVARPDALMVATDVLEELQVTPDVRAPVVPLLYVAVTENCCVAPAARVAAGGVTVMDVTVSAGAATTRAAVPLTPFNDAVIVLEPAATPVAKPVVLTVATAGLEDVQVADEVMFAVEPSLYEAVAVSCAVAPTAMLDDAGVTAMLFSVLLGEVESVPVPGLLCVMEEVQPVMASINRRGMRRQTEREVLVTHRRVPIGASGGKSQDPSPETHFGLGVSFAIKRDQALSCRRKRQEGCSE